MDDVLPLESSVEVIDFKGDMRNGADEFVNGAVFLEPHPLDAVGTGAEADDEEPELLEVGFAGMGDGRWNANVVVPPPELSRDRRWFVIEPSSEVKTVRSGLWRGDGSVGNGYLVKETLGNDGAGLPNVWHQRRAQRVRCMPGLGRDDRCGMVTEEKDASGVAVGPNPLASPVTPAADPAGTGETRWRRER